MSYRSPCRQITQTARILSPLFESAKIFHRITHHDRRKLSSPPQRARHIGSGNSGAKCSQTEVQATKDTARVSEHVVKFSKFLHHTTHRAPSQLSSSTRQTARTQGLSSGGSFLTRLNMRARYARFGNSGAQRARTEVQATTESRFQTRGLIRKILAPHHSP